MAKLYDKSRRRWSWVTTGAATLVLAGCLIGVALHKGDETQSWYTTASLTNEEVVINEIIDNDFGNSRNRGIWRDIPELATGNIIDVSSPTANGTLTLLDEFGESRAKLGCQSEGSACLRIGDPDINWRGLHRYEISYELSMDDFTGVGLCDRAGESFCWNAVPERWEYGIKEVTVQINNAGWLENMQCRVGDKAPSDGCSIQQYENFVIAESFEHPSFTPLIISADVIRSRRPGSTSSDVFLYDPPPMPTPDQAKFDWGYMPYIPLIIGFLFLGILLSTLFVRRRGRDVVKVGGATEAAFADSNKADSKPLSLSKMKEMVTLSFAPPEGIEPYQASIILHEKVESAALQSWFLDQSVKGHITIEGKKGEKLQYISDVEPKSTGPYGVVLREIFGRDAHETKPTVDLEKDPPTPINKHGSRRPFVEKFRNSSDQPPPPGVTKVDEVSSGGDDRSGFISAWSYLNESLQAWFDNSDYWFHNNVSMGKRKWIPTVIALFFGAIACASLSGTEVGPGMSCFCVFIVGISLPFITHRWELLVRSPKGSGLWLQIEGFRRFLQTSEQRHVEEASKKGVLREYTAWAVALGEIEHWKNTMLNAANVQGTSISSGDIYFAGSVHTMSSASVAPSSSSSGGGGGGGGGGGVGGGGGGW